MVYVVSLVMLVAAVQATPSLGDVRKLFEAGKYGEVMEAVSSHPDSLADPRVRYLVARVAQKQNDTDKARAAYAVLAGRGEDDPWRYIGQSANSLLDAASEGAKERALAASAKAVELGPDVPEAQFQLGLAASYNNDFARAAAAFSKTGTLDPTDAYAQYYAGISYYKAKRVDLMAASFERFLKMAPQAPERGEVESIMRTIRRR
jgi:cytochrome c-type biogenesis protein CcmH/NrfG